MSCVVQQIVYHQSKARGKIIHPQSIEKDCKCNMCNIAFAVHRIKKYCTPKYYWIFKMHCAVFRIFILQTDGITFPMYSSSSFHRDHISFFQMHHTDLDQMTKYICVAFQ